VKQMTSFLRTPTCNYAASSNFNQPRLMKKSP
jgi:hypothetical protein